MWTIELTFFVMSKLKNKAKHALISEEGFIFDASLRFEHLSVKSTFL